MAQTVDDDASLNPRSILLRDSDSIDLFAVFVCLRTRGMGHHRFPRPRHHCDRTRSGHDRVDSERTGCGA